MFSVDELLKQPGAWLNVNGNTEIIVSSRVRLARNLAGHSFPGWAKEEEALQLWQNLAPLLAGLIEENDAPALEMAELNRVDRSVLVERHLISRDLSVTKQRGSGLVLKRDEHIAVMVNEEDHLRIQALSPGLVLRDLWRQVDTLDSAVEQRLTYAFSPQLGYLTACPTNVGTGLRASVMMHLPGLVLANEISGIIKGVSKIGLAVRGLWGEGTDAAGNMFQISNQITLGEREEDIINRLEQIVLEIVEHERNARLRLLQKRESMLRDHVGRAIGILANAYLLNSRETLDLLSALRLGIDTGIVVSWPKKLVDELFLLIQPGHLQKLEGRHIGAEKRDLARARLVRERLAAAGK